MWSRIVLLTAAGLLFFCATAQHGALTVAFYNVENFFDTVDDAGYDDGDFTPQGAMKWDGAKFRDKRDNLAKVISGIDGMPDIIGLCEVENVGVLEELLYGEALKSVDYDFVTFPSGDARGIDLALIFRIPAVKLSAASSVVSAPGVRNILHAVFEAEGGERLHVLVCHLPSVPSGSRRRKAAAEALRSYAERLAEEEPGCKMVIMGDFNANPGSAVMSKIAPAGDTLLYNPFGELYAKGYGSYLYRRRWNMYDNIMVGRNMLSGEGVRYVEGSAHIFVRDFVMQRTGRFAGYPLRSFSGREYIGGYSDHLPVYVQISTSPFLIE